MPPTDEAREAARQLRRAATSGRSNYRAARNARSRAEFTSRLGEAFEEIDEARAWLEYLGDAAIANNASLLQEALELTKIFARAVQTARRNQARSRDFPKPAQT